jgi:cyclase
MLEALTLGRASAALIASIVHYGEYSIPGLKTWLREQGCKVRL